MNASPSVNKPAFSYDFILVAVTVSIMVIGYIMVASSSLHLGIVGPQKNIFHYPLMQLVHIGVGIGLAMIVAKIPLVTWEKYRSPLFIGGLFLLVIVLIPGIGVKVNGSIRWLALPGFRVQVSELVKFSSVIYMAGYITRHQNNLQQSMYGTIKPLLLFAVACLLLLMEPDLGSSVVILMIAMGMMFLGGARLNIFLILLGLLATAIGLLIFFAEYRWARMVSFLNPFDDYLKSGYQLSQALISFGRGEIFGVGLGSGIQKLFYLPEAHTDFIFSVLGEELGLFGVMVVIGLFTILIWRAFRIGETAEKNNQLYAAFIAYGIGIWLGFQCFVNMGVNMGILPTKGLTLPLMSYGGSSMIVMCAAIGLLYRVHHETINPENN